MSKIKLIISELGIDGWIFGLTALGAVVIGILDFTPLIDITSDASLKMVLVALGLTMAAIVAQTSKRTVEMQELQDAIGTVSFQSIERRKEFPLHIMQRISKAENFVLIASLNHTSSPPNPLDELNRNFEQALTERVKKKEISLRRVEVIFTKDKLETAIARLLSYDETDYLVRYYEPPPQAIPILNIISIDNEEFYIGAYGTGDIISGEQVLYVKNPQIIRFLESYWNDLWYSAKPLNEGKRINWDELKVIALRLGMNDTGFDLIVKKLKNKIRSQ